MKKILFMAALAMATMTAGAQGLSVNVGGVIPMGSFASYENNGDGGAATGFGVGLKYTYATQVNGLGLFAAADFFYNPLCDKYKDFLKGSASLAGVASVKNTSMSKYFDIPVMVGANYNYALASDLSFWGEAGLGVNFCQLTALEYEATVLGTKMTGKTTYDMGTTFAFELGVGVTWAQTYSLGLHYYNLGTSTLDGELNVAGVKTKFDGGEVTPSMLVLKLGYTF